MTEHITIGEFAAREGWPMLLLIAGCVLYASRGFAYWLANKLWGSRGEQA